MITINFYGLMSNKRIQSERVPIYYDLNSIIRTMQEQFKSLITVKDQEYVYNYCFPYMLFKPETERYVFLSQIYGVFPPVVTEELKSDDSLFKLKTYLITPNGKCLLVTNMKTVVDSFSYIEEQGINKLREDDRTGVKKLEQLQDEMIALKDNRPTTKDYMIATTVLAYVYQLIDEDIERNRVKIQADMNASIKQVREENDEIRNELDILNHQLKNVFNKPGELDDDEFEYCIYNGKEITQEEMVELLSTHVLPEYLIPQVDINDTLDDSYRIETKKAIIVRSEGGGLKITRKANS